MKKKVKNGEQEKKTGFVRPLLLGLGVMLLLLALTVAGCSRGNKPDESAPTDTTESAANTLEESPSTDSAGGETTTQQDALLSYYESLIEELRAQLLQEKEDRYISDHEYKLRLEELEATLKAWEEAAKKEDVPTGGDAETEPPETQPEETQPPLPTAPFDYRLENGEVIITAYKGHETTVTVPTQIDGYPVTAIDDHAFQNTAIVSVILPGSVKSIGWFAFYGCFGLEIVAIPASVTDISYAAFDGCPKLTLLCPSDSYAARYAVSFGLRHEYV